MTPKQKAIIYSVDPITDDDLQRCVESAAVFLQQKTDDMPMTGDDFRPLAELAPALLVAYLQAVQEIEQANTLRL